MNSPVSHQKHPLKDLKVRLRSLKTHIPFLRKRYELFELEKMVGPFGHWQELRQFQIEFLKSRGLRPHHSLLDIGCGPIQGGLAFIEYLLPGKYVGVDIRPEPINAAYQQIANAGLAAKNPLLLISDSFGRNELSGRTFDYVWASQILYHLDHNLLTQCLEQVSARLKPGGKFYGNIIFTPDTEGHWNAWEGFPFYVHSLELLQKLGDHYGLSMQFLGTMEDFGYPDIEDLKMYFMLEFTRNEHQEQAKRLKLIEMA